MTVVWETLHVVVDLALTVLSAAVILGILSVLVAMLFVRMGSALKGWDWAPSWEPVDEQDCDQSTSKGIV